MCKTAWLVGKLLDLTCIHMMLAVP